MPEVSGEDHSHDYLELTYILSGKARYYIEGKRIFIAAGGFVSGNPGLVHRFELRKGKKPPIEVYIGLSNFHFQDMPPQSLIFCRMEHQCCGARQS